MLLSSNLSKNEQKFNLFLEEKKETHSGWQIIYFQGLTVLKSYAFSFLFNDIVEEIAIEGDSPLQNFSFPHSSNMIFKAVSIFKLFYPLSNLFLKK